MFSRGRKDPQEVVTVHDYKSMGCTISLGKASLPINSSGLPKAGVDGCSGLSKPPSVALIQVFRRMGRAIRGKRLAKTRQVTCPQAYEKSGFVGIEKPIAKSIPCLSSFLESHGGLQLLLQLNTVLTSPTKSFTNTLGFDPGSSLIVGIEREASARALIFGEGVEKQRNTQGYVIRGLALVDFCPFPSL
jgi:hypothetical protein